MTSGVAPAPAQTTASGRLKSETAHLHRRAEESPFQRALAKGRVSHAAYAQHLAQMLALHGALEPILLELGGRVPAIRSVLRDHHIQEPLLRDDLAVLGVAPESVEPNGATRALIAEINRSALESPLQILGMLYVLEGANNGGRFIVINVRKALGLRAGRGDRYLDPYGEDQPRVWAQFKADLDQSVTDPAEISLLVAGAFRVYEGILAIGDEMVGGGALGDAC